MKNTSINLWLILIALIFTAGCKSNEEIYVYEFRNSSGFDVVVTSPLIDDLNELVPSGQTVSVYLSDFFVSIDISPVEPTDKKFKWNIDDDLYLITSYDFDIVYAVSGTAQSASYTINTSEGGTSQGTRDLPYSIEIKDYFDDWVYLSSQNQGENGSVKVEIFIKDKLAYSDQTNESFGIATASGDY